jgi:hypothetical protein
MRSEWRSFPLATITFVGEQQDIIDPEAGVLVAGQKSFGWFFARSVALPSTSEPPKCTAAARRNVKRAK